MLRIRLWPILNVLLLIGSMPAVAQVTVDLHALQALPESGSAAPAPRRIVPQPPRPSPPRSAVEVPATPSVSGRASGTASTGGTTAPAPSAALPPGTAAAAPPAVPPALPQQVPATASIAPVPAPAEPAAPPPPPPVSDTATTKAEPENRGLRLLFGAGSADLNPDSAAAVKQLATSTPTSDAVTFNVTAFATGNRDDPSTARRLSLSRAMAVRSALMSDGIASARIYVKALGEAYGSGPADRADIAVLGANADSGSAAAAK